MDEQIIQGMSISIDMKKSRIRIYKQTMHLLGNPLHIQLLFDPVHKVIAIRCPEQDEPGAQELHVRPCHFSSHNCVEFYSMSLIQKMCSVNSALQNKCTYRLYGDVCPAKRVGYFPMITMQRIDDEKGAQYA